MPAPPFLSAQLGMDQGFGLIVENVLHDSPAQAAGVQKFDVLKGLNDQQLVSPEQLSRLVHRLGKDAEATITLVRKGQEQKLSIKVGEKMMPAREEPRGFGFSGRPEIPELQEEMRRRMQEAGGPGGNEMMRRMQERMRDYQKRMREYQESMRGYQDRIREWQRNPGSEPPQMPRIPEFPGESGGQERREGPGQPGMRPADLLREMRPGGPPDVRAEWSDGSSRWNAARARVKMRDADGELEIALKDGKRILTIKGPEGEVVFTGPVDTPEERLAIPERYRGKLAAMAPPPPSDFAPEGERPHPRSPGLVVPPVQRAPDVQ